MRYLINSIKMLLLMMVVTGLIYPLAITAAGQIAFHKKANGSFITVNNRKIGSELVGQNFSNSVYFYGRPSFCNYETVPSGASNKSVTNKEFNEYVTAEYDKLASLYQTRGIPSELYLKSASGLDPHISLKGALLQIDRVSAARGMSVDQKKRLTELVYQKIEKRDLLFLGEERINVLKLNIATDLIK